MTSLLVLAPLVVALVVSTLTLVVRSWPHLQRAISVAGTLGYVSSVGALAWAVVFAPDATVLVHQVGGWRAPFGITLVADALSAFMLAVTAVVVLFALVFSVPYVDPENQRVYYHPLFHFLVAGMTGAFLTGDLFNLFVWFEVMLMTSYVFVAFYGGASHTAAAVRYVVLNVVGAALMLLAIGGLYATTGTLNMAEIATVLADPGTDAAPVVGLAALLLAAFALKAGLVPFQFWVPSAYRAAPLPIAAVFAGASKKVGMYAIVRLYFTVLGDASVTTEVPLVGVESPLAFLAPVLLVMGLASILVGGVGAVSRTRLDGLLAYSSIGQVGFIAVPIAIAAGTSSASLRHLGILAGLVYALHHALAKSLLFLSAGAVRDAAGTTRLAQLSGLGERSQVFSMTVLVGSLSLVGIPPLAGFFGKFFVFSAAAEQFATASVAGSGLILAVLLVGALLTIVYATRVWVGGFWGAQSDRVQVATLDRAQVAILAVLAAVVVAVGLGFEPVYQFADAAATAALDTDGYVGAIESGGES
jgi:multicomponent Na+:H+ antiporter subunit D